MEDYARLKLITQRHGYGHMLRTGNLFSIEGINNAYKLKTTKNHVINRTIVKQSSHENFHNGGKNVLKGKI